MGGHRTVLDLSTYQGDPGADGQGVPTGGTTGQYLKKTSNADFATGWVDLAPLLLAGGTMAGDIAMDTHKVTGLADPSAAQDAVTLAELKRFSKLLSFAGMALPAPQNSGQYAQPAGNTSTGAPTQSDEICFPVMFMEDWTATVVGVYVTSGAAASSARIGIRPDAGNAHFAYPSDTVTDWGTVATTGTGLKTIAISKAFTAWTIYWISITSQGGAPTYTSFNAIPFNIFGDGTNTIKNFKKAGVTGALGNFQSISSPNLGGVTPRVMFGLS